MKILILLLIALAVVLRAEDKPKEPQKAPLITTEMQSAYDKAITTRNRAQAALDLAQAKMDFVNAQAALLVEGDKLQAVCGANFVATQLDRNSTAVICAPRPEPPKVEAAPE